MCGWRLRPEQYRAQVMLLLIAAVVGLTLYRGRGFVLGG